MVTLVNRRSSAVDNWNDVEMFYYYDVYRSIYVHMVEQPLMNGRSIFVNMTFHPPGLWLFHADEDYTQITNTGNILSQ
jgi:hypothetical protein